MVVVNVKKKSWIEKTLKEKFKHIKSNITIEPMVACFIMSSVLASLATQNLNLEKACRVNLNYGEVICDALQKRQAANYTEEEIAVQSLVAGMLGWKSVVQNLMVCSLILFWGGWSDKHSRRKPCMLIPIVGELLMVVGLILCTYFENWPLEAAGITEAVFPGLAGGWFTMLMGVFSYIADITKEEERTLRIGIANLCCSLSVPIGMAFSGVLLRQIGFYGVFSISASLYIIALLYGYFCVEEPKKKTVAKQTQVSSDKSLLADFFNKEHVVETFKVALRKGDNHRRLKVSLLLILFFVIFGPMHGEMSVLYLFTRFKFNWSEVEFSFFLTYTMLASLIGTFVFIGIFSHHLKIHDTIIGVVSSISKILSSFVYAFAAHTWQLYLGPIVDILSGSAFIALRSITSKLVKSDELGKVNALCGVVEALAPFVYSPMYTQVYRATIHTLPGAFFLIGSALTTPAVVIFMWMYKVQKQDQQKMETKPEIYNKHDDPEALTNKKDGKMIIVNRQSAGMINSGFVHDD